jgi:hypothetical protein
MIIVTVKLFVRIFKSRRYKKKYVYSDNAIYTKYFLLNYLQNSVQTKKISKFF